MSPLQVHMNSSRVKTISFMRPSPSFRWMKQSSGQPQGVVFNTSRHATLQLSLPSKAVTVQALSLAAGVL